MPGKNSTTGNTPDYNLVYDPNMDHWYKTNSFFDDDFETLSCVVDKMFPRVVVLGRDRMNKTLKLAVANVGWYRKPGTDIDLLHLMKNPKALDPIDKDEPPPVLHDGVMFALGKPF